MRLPQGCSRMRRVASYPLPPVELVNALRDEQPGWVSDVIQANGELTLVVPREQIVEVCSHMKTAPGFEFDLLADLTGADRGTEEEPRFEVNYHLFSTTKFHRLRLKVLLQDDDPHVPSVTGVWQPGTTFPCMVRTPSFGFTSPTSTRHIRQLATTVSASCQQYDGMNTPASSAAWMQLSFRSPISTGLSFT